MNLRLLSVVALAIVALSGCGKSAAPVSSDAAAVATTTKPNPYAPPDPARFEAAIGPDPCTLLDPKQVEPMLGEPLAVLPYRANSNRTPNADGDYCTYRGKDLRSIVIDVDWTGGKKMMKVLGGITSGMNAVAKGEVKLPISGTTLDGDWDVATVANCCTLMALRDDTLVTINVGSSKATQEQAAKLADDAMKNLAKPLQINGAAGVAAATALLKTMPTVANDCALLTRAEAESVLGPMTADPLQRDNYCAYRFTNAHGHRDELSVTIKNNGYHEFRQTNNIYETADAAGAQAGAGMNANDKALVTGLIGMNSRKPEGSGPWDDAASSQFEFDLVRRDVLVRIGSATMDHDQMRALAEKVGAKL